MTYKSKTKPKYRPNKLLNERFCKKHLAQINGFCYLKLFKHQYRPVVALSLLENPTQPRVWKWRKYMHEHVDKFVFTTNNHLTHVWQTKQYVPRRFEATFGSHLGRIGSSQPDQKLHPYPDQHVVLVDVQQRTPTEQEARNISAVFLHKQTARQDWAKEHPEDQTLGQYVRDYFKAPRVNEPLKDNEAFRDYLTRTYTQNMTTQQEKETFRRTLLLCCALEQTCAHQRRLAAEKESALDKQNEAENHAKRQKRDSEAELGKTMKLLEETRAEAEQRFELLEDLRKNLHASEKQLDRIREQHNDRVQHLDERLGTAETNLQTIWDRWSQQLVIEGTSGVDFNIAMQRYLARLRSIMTGGNDTLSFRLDQLEQETQEFQEQLDDARSEAYQWRLMIDRAIAKDMDIIDTEARILQLTKRGDQAPYWDLLNTPPQDRRPTTSEDLASRIKTHVMTTLGGIWAEIPAQFRPEGTALPEEHIKGGISLLKNKIHLLSSSHNRLSTTHQASSTQNQPPSNMAEQTRTNALREIYNQFDQRFRTNPAGEEMPFSEENLTTILGQVNANLLCTHVRDMDGAIQNHAGPENRMNWVVMLNHVHRHCNPQDFEQPPSRAASPAPSHMSIATSQQRDPEPEYDPRPIRAWKKFEGNLPEFNGDSEAWPMWKARLRNFYVLNKGCPGDEFAAYVFAKLDGSAAIWATQTDPVRFSMIGTAALNAHLTMERIISDMEKEFADATLEKRNRARLHTIQQKADTPMTQHVATFRDLVVKSGRDTNSDYIHERFIGSCHWDVRNDLEDMAITKKRNGERFPFNEIVEWAQLKDSQYTRHRAANKKDERPRKDAPAESTMGTAWQLPATCANHTDRNGCPAHLRGSLGDRESAGGAYKRAAIAELGRCLTCRGIKPPGEEGYVANPPEPAQAWPDNTPQPEPRTRGETRGYRGRGRGRA